MERHAIVWMLRPRHLDNPAWRALLAAVTGGEGAPAVAIGGAGPFERGLYGCSEMLVDGFLELIDAGVVRRRAYGLARTGVLD